MNKYYCVKDEEGILRPRAGIWNFDEIGKHSSEDYLKSSMGRGCTIVEIEIKEII